MSRAWLLLSGLLVGTLAACGNSSPQRQREADWRTMTASREAAGEKTMNVEVRFGAGVMDVQPGTAGTLYRAALRYDRNQFQPVVKYADGTLRVGLDDGRLELGRGNHGANRLDLTLDPNVPLDLDVQYGAGEGTMELGGLSVRSAKIATGASKTTVAFSKPTQGACGDLEVQAGAAKLTVTGIGNLSPERMHVQGGVGDLNLDFSGAWRTNPTIKVDMGLGSLKLAVPRDVGLRVRKQSVLASFDAPDMVKQGDTYESRGYDNTSRRLDVEIDAALGSVRVHWIDGGSSF